MKMNIRMAIVSACLITAPFLTMAQSPPHPNNGNEPGSENGPVGGGAPIGGGLTLLFAMSVAYGAGKFYKARSPDSI